MKQNKIDYVDAATETVIEIGSTNQADVMKAYAALMADKKEEKRNDGVQ